MCKWDDCEKQHDNAKELIQAVRCGSVGCKCKSNQLVCIKTVLSKCVICLLLKIQCYPTSLKRNGKLIKCCILFRNVLLSFNWTLYLLFHLIFLLPSGGDFELLKQRAYSLDKLVISSAIYWNLTRSLSVLFFIQEALCHNPQWNLTFGKKQAVFNIQQLWYFHCLGSFSLRSLSDCNVCGVLHMVVNSHWG